MKTKQNNILIFIIIVGILIIGLGIYLQVTNMQSKENQQKNNTNEIIENKSNTKEESNLSIDENDPIEKAKKIVLNRDSNIKEKNLKYLSQENGLYKLEYKSEDNETIIYIVNIEDETYKLELTAIRGDK